MRPVFFNAPGKRLFGLVHLPDSSTIPRKWVLHVPAFAEEMNKCRAMVSAQARAFAAQGIAVVVPDLGGTGDSEGEFAEASWSEWKAQIAYLLDWMQEQGAQEICLWGVRLGALLAVNVAAENPDSVQELLLWQPVYSGKQAMTQFMRLRMASSMMQGQQESANELRDRCHAGELLEVAGYELSPRLMREIDGLDITTMYLPADCKVFLFEVAGNPDKPLTIPSRNHTAVWASAGLQVEAGVCCGEPFWSTQEIASAPALIDCSSKAIADSGNTAIALPKQLQMVSDGAEKALVFPCQGEQLTGILHRGTSNATRGILVVVGGPQYRVGSHRQFLQMARDLAQHGVPVFRFDYRGMGDSSGDLVDFLGAGDDIRAAIDAFRRHCPRLADVVLWGLCDAATAATFYAPSDPRVVGLVLLNPWVRSESGEAKAYIKHYYLQRFFSKGFWTKIFGGQFNFKDSITSFFEKLRNIRQASAEGGNSEGEIVVSSLLEKMEKCLDAYPGRAMFVLSGNDLTAAEFSDAVKGSVRFRKLLDHDRFVIHNCVEADHTFSRKVWKDQVSRWTLNWLRSLDEPA